MDIFKNYQRRKQQDEAARQMMSAIDGFIDQTYGRGLSTDRTQRLEGGKGRRSDDAVLGLYRKNGFLQRIINSVAHDATREWFVATPKNADKKTENFDEVLQQALLDHDVKGKVREMIKWMRVFSKGSGMFFGTHLDNAEEQRLIGEKLPDKIRKVDYLNVFDNPKRITIQIDNDQNPTKKDYNKPRLEIDGEKVHESRYVWMVNEFIAEDKEGLSVVDTVFDAVGAQDSALWSASTLMQMLSLLVFKSDAFVGLPPHEKGDFLSKMKSFLNTQGAVGVKENEELSRLDYKFSGLKDMFDFIFENMSGASGIPKNILLGRAHGVITAGEFDTINYYAMISQFQENVLEKPVRKIIDLFTRVEGSDLQKMSGGPGFEYTLDWEPLWKLDPVSQAEVNEKNANVDKINIETGKVAPEEARLEDENVRHLGPFEKEDEDRTQPPQEGTEEDDGLLGDE